MEHSNIDANIVIELALNKVIELQKQSLLAEAKLITLSQEYNRLKTKYDDLVNKSDEWNSVSTSTNRKSTTK